jgi:hypothetical protein
LRRLIGSRVVEIERSVLEQIEHPFDLGRKRVLAFAIWQF